MLVKGFQAEERWQLALLLEEENSALRARLDEAIQALVTAPNRDYRRTWLLPATDR